MRSVLLPALIASCLSSHVLAQGPYPPRPVSRLTIPAAASIHGLAGTFFKTDIWVMNQSFTTSIGVGLDYSCSTCDSVSYSNIPLAPREARLLVDVVQSVFSRPETAGAIQLTWLTDVGSVAATSRTYSDAHSGNGTYGTAVPALIYSQATTSTLFLGLANNGGDLTSGYRSNVGAVNANALIGAGVPPWASVTYALYDSNGTLLGSPISRSVHWTAQVNDVFRAAGVGSLVTRNVSLVVTSDLPVYAYVTVIDNQTGDSVFPLGTTDSPRP
jgi:hypothetical protein